MSIQSQVEKASFKKYYGRLAAVGHILLLVTIMPMFTILFSATKYFQRLLLINSRRQTSESSLHGLVKHIQSEIAKESKVSKVPTIIIAGAHFSKTLTIMRCIKAVLPGKKSQIILTDSRKYSLNGAHFSRYCDAFEVVHADPVAERELYAAEMVKIAKRYKVSNFIKKFHICC